jgi:preprotein translocase subunit SecD
MRALFYTYSVMATLIVGLATGHSQTTNALLAFYIVSEEKIEGGRFIDTTNFPKLGYVAAKPDLIITNLVNVYPTERSGYDIIRDKAGNETAVPRQPRESLSIQLSSDDAGKFTGLTEDALGKKLLVMLGEKPLIAPVVRARIQGGHIDIDDINASDLKKIADELKKLVR